MPKPKKYKEEMSTLIVKVRKTDKAILQRNTDDRKSLTSMVQDAIKAYIIQEGLK